MGLVHRILVRRQVFCFLQRRQHSQALEHRVAEGGSYAARPQFIRLLHRILARRQVFGFRQRRQHSQALEHRKLSRNFRLIIR
jgi:hypothetical protein